VNANANANASANVNANANANVNVNTNTNADRVTAHLVLCFCELLCHSRIRSDRGGGGELLRVVVVAGVDELFVNVVSFVIVTNAVAVAAVDVHLAVGGGVRHTR
jgi:hypothetical protein